MQNPGLNNNYITRQCLNFHTAEFCDCETTTDSSGAQQDIHLSTLSLGSDVAVRAEDIYFKSFSSFGDSKEDLQS